MGSVEAGLLDKLPAPPSGKRGWPWTAECDPAIYDTALPWPKISIVTPSYNQGEFLEESIRSVLLQNYPNLEYIVMDGGSSDRSVEILKKYDRWLDYWVSEKDEGQSHAINKGLKRASGDFFNWINSDDYLTRHSLFEIAKKIMAHPKCRVLTSPINFVDETGRFLRINPPTSLKALLWDTLQAKGLNQPGMYFKLSHIKALNGVNERFHYSMDLDLWKRYLLTFGRAHIYQIDHTTVNFRFQDNSKSVGEGWGENSAFENENKRAFLAYLGELKNERRYRFIQRELHLAYDPIPVWSQRKALSKDRLQRWVEYIVYHLFRESVRKGKYCKAAISARHLGFSFFLKKLVNRSYFQSE